MAATYTEITVEEMDQFLKRGFRALRPRQGNDRGEIYYDLTLSDHVLIRVWTSIHPKRGTGAEIGTDAIRVQLLGKKSQRPLLAKAITKIPIVKRTQGWRNSLQERIEDVYELYEDKHDYFDERASGEPTAPAQVEPPPTPPEEQEPAPIQRRFEGPFTGTFSRLKSGDWGLRVNGVDVQSGDFVNTTTREGRKQRMLVDAVVWRGDGYSLCTISRQARQAAELDALDVPSYDRSE